MRTLDIPGMALAVVRDGQVVYAKGYGRADDSGRPFTPRTPLVLASVSKSFAALATMQLVEAGKIDLDAPVTTYLPWFTMADAEHSAKIRVRDLIYQTSGISTFSGREFRFEADASGLEDEVRRLKEVPLAGEPGVGEFRYSNTNYEILGLIVQTVAGQPYTDYMKENIYTPLGMAHSYSLATLAEARADGMAEGYTVWLGGRRTTGEYFPASRIPSGGLISSAEDLAGYALMHLNGGDYAGQRLLSADGVATLHRPGVLFDYPQEGYAMGWFAGWLWGASTPDGDTLRVPRTIEHDGWGKGVRTHILMVPSAKLAVVALMNSDDYARASGYNFAALGTARLLLGVQPGDMVLSEDALTQYMRPLALGISGLLLLGVIWSVFNIRRWGRDPHSRPSGLWWILRAVVLPLAIDAAILYFALVVLPAINESPLLTSLRFTPELAALLIPILALALLWGVVRTVLYSRVLRRD